MLITYATSKSRFRTWLAYLQMPSGKLETVTINAATREEAWQTAIRHLPKSRGKIKDLQIITWRAII